MNKKLSIVIVTYNSEKLIYDCLDSIFQFNDIGDQLEIIIVDNCSNDCDNVFTKIKNDYSKNIILIKSKENNGYGAGNNLGIQQVSSPYFVVMNPDVRIVEPIFNKIVDFFNIDENLGLLGVRFVDGSSHLHYKPEFCSLVNLIFGSMLIKYKLYSVEKMHFSGSFMIFNKKIFLDAGSFDENLFLFYEEADISNRILRIQKKTLLSTDLFVQHLVHGREVNKYLLKVGAESRQYYFKKYSADIKKYYRLSLIMWNLKYAAAFILRDKYRMKHILPWIDLCKKNGIVL